jgi:hypothetical protein
MKNRNELRRQIDGDKQKIQKDFEALKQGKIKSDQIADKYAYNPKDKETNQSGIKEPVNKS